MPQAMGGAIRKRVDSQNRQLSEPSVQVDQPDMLLGYSVYCDPNMGAVGTGASTAIAFGDWSPFVIAEVGTVRLERSTDYAFANDLITYRTASNLRDLTGTVKKGSRADDIEQ
jgi:HK97 family phage major capsid protein